MIYPPQSVLTPRVTPDIARYAPDPEVDNIFGITARAWILGSTRGPTAAQFSAIGIQNGVVDPRFGDLVVIEELWVGSGIAGTVGLLVGNSFAGIANLSGGGSKGTRDGRLGDGFPIGNDVLSFVDDGALGTGLPAGTTRIATLPFFVAGAFPTSIGPFYLRPTQFIMVISGVVNQNLSLVALGHVSTYARRR